MNLDEQLITFYQWAFPGAERKKIEEHIAKLDEGKKQELVGLAVKTKKKAVHDLRSSLKIAAESKAKIGEDKKLEELLQGMS